MKKKFNLIDLMIVLVILGVLAFIGYKLFLGDKVQKQDTVKLRIKVEFMERGKEIFEPMKLGGEVNISLREKAMGTIIEKTEPLPHEYTTFDAQKGEYKLEQATPEANKYTGYITIEADAVDNGDCFKVVTTEIRIGTQLYVQGLGFLVNGTIVGMEVVNE